MDITLLKPALHNSHYLIAHGDGLRGLSSSKPNVSPHIGSQTVHYLSHFSNISTHISNPILGNAIIISSFPQHFFVHSIRPRLHFQSNTMNKSILSFITSFHLCSDNILSLQLGFILVGILSTTHNIHWFLFPLFR